jgi:ferredoxin
VFDQSDDDFLVVVLDETPPAERREAVEQAARFCPGQAIRVDHDG